MKEMKRFLVVNGGCRGFIDDVEIVESELSLEDFVAEADAEARTSITEMMFDDELSYEENIEYIDEFIEEFNIGGEVYKGLVGGVTYGEETYEYILEVTKENEDKVNEFVDNDDLVRMCDFEEFFGYNDLW